MTDFVHAAPRVVPYDPAWAAAFADEAALLGTALTGVPHRVGKTDVVRRFETPADDL